MGRVRSADELMSSVQLVWRRRPRETLYVRAAPLTMLFPTRAQREVRERAREFIKLAKGKKGLAPDGLPWAAHYLRLGMAGFRASTRKRKPKLWEVRLVRSRVLRPHAITLPRALELTLSPR